MLFKRRDVTSLAGVSTARVFYFIKDVLRSVTRESQQRVIRAIEEQLYTPGAIGHSLIAKTDFIGFNFPNVLKPIHARRPGLSKRLMAASLSGIVTSDAMVERTCLAKLVCEKGDLIGMAPAGPNDDPLCAIGWLLT